MSHTLTFYHTPKMPHSFLKYSFVKHGKIFLNPFISQYIFEFKCDLNELLGWSLKRYCLFCVLRGSWIDRTCSNTIQLWFRKQVISTLAEPRFSFLSNDTIEVMLDPCPLFNTCSDRLQRSWTPVLRSRCEILLHSGWQAWHTRKQFYNVSNDFYISASPSD